MKKNKAYLALLLPVLGEASFAEVGNTPTLLPLYETTASLYLEEWMALHPFDATLSGRTDYNDEVVIN